MSDPKTVEINYQKTRIEMKEGPDGYIGISIEYPLENGGRFLCTSMTKKEVKELIAELQATIGHTPDTGSE